MACGLEVKSTCFSRWGPAFSSDQLGKSQLPLTPVPEGSRVFWPLKASHVLGAQTSRPLHANVTKIQEKGFKKQSVLRGFNCQLDTVLSYRGGNPWLRICLDQIALWACLDYQVRRVEPTVGHTIPGLIKKLAKHKPRSQAGREPPRSVTPWILPEFLLEVLSWLPRW